jgi:secondary thiamine-phosphate synthase enzyme
MRQTQRQFTVSTRGKGLIEITDEVRAFAGESKFATGLLTVYCRHTSASLLIQENADPDVGRDFLAFFNRLVPDGDPLFIHTVEGPDDMPAHVKAALTQTSLTIPIADGKLVLGTWQGIFVFEHRNRPHERHIVLHIVGS